MAVVISPEIAAAHLRAEEGDDADLVTLYVSAAVRSAADFLNREIYADTDDMAAAIVAGTAGSDPIVVNDAIRAAILLILGRLYANREDTVVGATVFDLPTGSKQLLYPYRVGLGV
ncbi:head-tail connector protein [Robbsia sp. Bb-Pol-6]|uniref:Head-tail connector protein n=1 Tax=Robbsia betulipollinis TaxID=2981849 RepID=A0ABT3ZH24_9BURK|nr:head-tail connector protein [Robbsia betulipollinis]MCY0385652.1 head-tail connector protein [Robbsia betulipollinis]